MIDNSSPKYLPPALLPCLVIAAFAVWMLYLVAIEPSYEQAVDRFFSMLGPLAVWLAIYLIGALPLAYFLGRRGWRHAEILKDSVWISGPILSSILIFGWAVAFNPDFFIVDGTDGPPIEPDALERLKIEWYLEIVAFSSLCGVPTAVYWLRRLLPNRSSPPKNA